MKTGNRRIDAGTEKTIVGSDEAGYGCMAGPLVVVAVALPREFVDIRVRDSKKMSARQREKLYNEFHPKYLNHIVCIDAGQIDQMGVYNALLAAHKEAIKGVLARLPNQPNGGLEDDWAELGHNGWPSDVLVIIDGDFDLARIGMPASNAVSLIKGDDKVPSCSMASIIAKEHRDRIMVEMSGVYPGYGFANSRGYVTKEHQAALERLGPCPIHRKSYAPVRRVIEERERETQDADAQELWALLDED